MSDAFEEMIERTEVTVTTPNEKVTASVRAQRDVTVRFDPGFYATCSTLEMQENLQKVARLLFAAARKEHLDQIRELTGNDVESRPEPQTQQDRVYYAELEQLFAEGESDDGLVTVTAVGQQNMAVTITPGVLDRVPQGEFEAACGQAADRLLADTERKAAALRWTTYLADPRSA